LSPPTAARCRLSSGAVCRLGNLARALTWFRGLLLLACMRTTCAYLLLASAGLQFFSDATN
jgi:hypothetical protein